MACAGCSLRQSQVFERQSYVVPTTTTIFMLNTHSILGCLVVLSLLVTLNAGFYLPGVAEKEYTAKEPPKLKVNKLTSTNTQLPFKFYYLPFCSPPNKELHDAPENLGEVIRGDKIEDAVYEVRTYASH